LRLGFAGTPDFAVPALDRLAAQHGICAVFTQPDRPAGRGRVLQSGPVKRRALELGITLHQPSSFKSPEAWASLRAAHVDALVVVAYGLILPREALEIPRWGCINIHASLLPRWRGAAPIQRAVLAGDPTTGVTIMRMETGLDTGPMLNSRTTAIKPTDTAKTLHDRLAVMGADLIAESLEGLAAGAIREVAQPAEGVTYARKIDKLEALIQWERSAEEISRQVRAFNPWPMAETRFNGAQLRIWEAEPLEAPSIHSVAARGAAMPAGAVLSATGEGIDVVCGAGVLRIHRLQLAGRKPLPAADFVRGHRLDGARLSASLSYS
jgi:methionyl-tRNA formyltransferase